MIIHWYQFDFSKQLGTRLNQSKLKKKNRELSLLEGEPRLGKKLSNICNTIKLLQLCCK